MLRDSDAAREFLELLFPDGRGYIDVSFMAADGPRVRRPRKGTEAALEQVAKCDGDNCYVGVASRKNGSIEGNVVRVEVEYAGVTGIIQAELIDPNTAIAFAATCLPEFMVVCALAKDRQAVFRRVESQ